MLSCCSAAAQSVPLRSTPDLTSHQRALADYFDRLCARDGSIDTLPACERLRDPSLSADQVRSMLDAFDPGPSLTAADSTLRIAASQNDNVMRRIAALRSGSRGLDLGGLDVGVGDQRIAGEALNAVSRPTLGGVLDGALSDHAIADRIGVFANGHVETGFANGADSASRRRVSDVTTGIDYRVRDGLVLGVGVGYSGTGGADVGAASGSRTLDIETWRSALFGTYFNEHFHVDGSLGYDTTQYASLRHVELEDMFGPTPAYAQGLSGGRQVSAQLTSAFDFRYGAWTFGPRVGASFVDAEVDPFQESGDYALAIGRQAARSLRSSAGAQISMPGLPIPWMLLKPRASADVVLDMTDRTDVVDVRLASDFDPTSDAAMRINRLGSGYFVWSVGAGAQVTRHLTGFVDYRSTVSADDVVSTDLSWGVRFEAPL